MLTTRIPEPLHPNSLCRRGRGTAARRRQTSPRCGSGRPGVWLCTAESLRATPACDHFCHRLSAWRSPAGGSASAAEHACLPISVLHIKYAYCCDTAASLSRCSCSNAGAPPDVWTLPHNPRLNPCSRPVAAQAARQHRPGALRCAARRARGGPGATHAGPVAAHPGEHLGQYGDFGEDMDGEAHDGAAAQLAAGIAPWQWQPVQELDFFWIRVAMNPFVRQAPTNLSSEAVEQADAGPC
jgi:hypothetical protein